MSQRGAPDGAGQGRPSSLELLPSLPPSPPLGLIKNVCSNLATAGPSPSKTQRVEQSAVQACWQQGCCEDGAGLACQAAG